MNRIKLQQRKPKCGNKWYPNRISDINLTDKPYSAAVISPHAGFIYSGVTSLKAVSNVKKNRVWFFGTSHFENPTSGLSIFPGDYHSAIGKVVFPGNISDKDYCIIEKYLSLSGHRTEEHSIENVLYAVNHFTETLTAFCGLVRLEDENDFEKISDDIAEVWKKDDSIIISTDWNHFVSAKVIDKLMKDVSELLEAGNIKKLYAGCKKGNYEACGIDSLYLASKILEKVNEKIEFEILESTNSSKVSYSDTCVGYIAAKAPDNLPKGEVAFSNNLSH